MDGYKQLNMVDAGFFSNKEASFKARQLFFQQKLDTVFFYSFRCVIFHNLLYYKCYFPYTGNRKGVFAIGSISQFSYFCCGRDSQQLYLQVAKQKETK